MLYPSASLYPGVSKYPSEAYMEPERPFLIVSAVQEDETSIRVTWVGKAIPNIHLVVWIAGTPITFVRQFFLQEDAPGSRSMVVGGLYAGFTWAITYLEHFSFLPGVDPITGAPIPGPGFTGSVSVKTVNLQYTRVADQSWFTTAVGTLTATADGHTATVDLADFKPKTTGYRANDGTTILKAVSPLITDDVVAGFVPTNASLTYKSRTQRQLTGLVIGRTYQVRFGFGAAFGDMFPLAVDYRWGVTNAKTKVNGRWSMADSYEPYATDASSGFIPWTFVAAATTASIFFETHDIVWSGTWANLKKQHIEELTIYPIAYTLAGANLPGVVAEVIPVPVVHAQEDPKLYLTDGTIEANDVVMDGSLVDYLDMYTNTGGAYWFMSKSGVFTLLEDPYQADPQAYFSDHRTVGAIGYHAPVVTYGTDNMVNDLTINNHKNAEKVLSTDDWAADDVTLSHTNPASIKLYGSIGGSLDIALFDNGLSLNQRIADVLTAGAAPKWQLSAFTVNVQADPRMALNMELFTVVEVEYKGMVQLSLVLGIDDDISDATTWERTYTVQQLDFYPASPTFREWGENYIPAGLRTFADFATSQGAETFGSFTDNPERT